jgi:hypothetical protein
MSLRLTLPAVALLALPALAFASPSASPPTHPSAMAAAMGSMPGMKSMPHKHHHARSHMAAPHATPKR